MATPEQINKAYRDRAKNCHPDVFPLNSVERYQAEQKFKKILQARETLIDPVKKDEYDNERQMLQDFYLSSMSHAYNFQAVKKETSKSRNESSRSGSWSNSYYGSLNDSLKNDKKKTYKKQSAKKYYAMSLKAIGYGDYNRAWIYFQSAKYLDPDLKMPPALWSLISKANYNL